MKSVVKFLSVVILFLSTSLSAQRTYKMLIQNSKLVIESVDVSNKNLNIEKKGFFPWIKRVFTGKRTYITINNKQQTT